MKLSSPSSGSKLFSPFLFFLYFFPTTFILLSRGKKEEKISIYFFLPLPPAPAAPPSTMYVTWHLPQ